MDHPEKFTCRTARIVELRHKTSIEKQETNTILPSQKKDMSLKNGRIVEDTGLA